MTAQLLMTCGLNDKRLPEFVLVRESTGTDGSFLISSIIGQQLKASQSKIVLACVHHAYSHYQNIGMRIGFNLNQVRERGRLKVIDLLNMIYEEELQLDDHLVEYMFDRIEKNLADVPEAEDCCLILDDISLLRIPSENDDLLIRFCEKLSTLRRNRTGHLSVIVKLNAYNVLPVIANSLDCSASLTITIDALKSGRFKEVDGRITISKPVMENAMAEEKIVLYKVNDRNVKTFVKGFVW